MRDLLVLTLTTAGAAKLAASAQPVACAPDAAGDAVRSDTTCDSIGPSGWPSRVSHCGLSVATTNRQASTTVAAWEKISQSLRIDGVVNE
jgi:hypothetical protein